eukprot:101882-Pyramimonas_sp.AAC.1
MLLHRRAHGRSRSRAVRVAAAQDSVELDGHPPEQRGVDLGGHPARDARPSTPQEEEYDMPVAQSVMETRPPRKFDRDGGHQDLRDHELHSAL